MNCQFIFKKRIHKYYTKIFVDSFNFVLVDFLINSKGKTQKGYETNPKLKSFYLRLLPEMG